MINQVHVLYVVPYTPTRIRTRPFNLLRGLARRGHAVTLATLWESDSDRAALQELDSAGIRIVSARLSKARSAWNSLRALPSPTPLQAVYCWQPELASIINSQLSNYNSPFDLVHVEHLRGARYGLALNSQFILHPSSREAILPIVWDSVDCISHLFEQAARNSKSPFSRIVTRLELGRTRRYEGLLVNQFDRVLVTSPVDAAALQALATNHHSPITVLPNGVDLTYFTPAAAPREPETIVFSGKMSYHANVTAALHLVNDIMPLVWSKHPHARVQIVGHNPPRQVRQSAICNHQSAIDVTGSVPDLRPYLRRATVAVAPIGYGAGIQNKVLEAMACATPVVASPQAVSALAVRDGEHLLVGDGAEAFARQVVRLLDDAELRRRIGASGRQYVEQCHDWDRIVERLEDIYQVLLDRPTVH